MAVALALTIAATAPASAQVSLTVEDARGLEAYLAGVATAELRFDKACGGLRQSLDALPDGAELRLSAGARGPEVAGGGESLRPLAQAVAGVVAVLADFGVGVGGDDYLLRIEGASVFVASAARGGRRFEDPCRALGFFMQLLIDDASDAAPATLAEAAARAAAGDAAAIFAAARETAAAGPTLAAGRATRVRLEPEGPDGVELPDDMAIAGAGGLRGRGLAKGPDGTVIGEIVVPADAKAGEVELLIFSAADRFTPIARVAATLTGGSRADATPGPATRTAPLAPGARLARELSAQGAVERFSFEAAESGTLRIASGGSTDLSARLTDASGAVIAADDDGGGAYNFLIETPVEPGAYTLEITHCCNGAGDYTLSVDLE